MLVPFLLSISSLLALDPDAKRGAEVFQKQKCTECHALNGGAIKPVGLNQAPDLGRRLNRDYTPAGLASRIWNHAPQMWTAMKKSGIDTPQMSEADTADLFAFFYAARYFDRPGDAARGKAVFIDKKCGTCHSQKGAARDVAEWKSLRDPVELVERMWNHAPQMLEAAKVRKMPFPALDSRELSDLLVYLQNLPALRNATYEFRLPTNAPGSDLLTTKGCTECHTGAKALNGERIGRQTLTDIAASMWNHAPEMRGKAGLLTSNEIREILGLLWTRSFFAGGGGKADRGSKLFTTNCSGCHQVATLAAKQSSAFSMVSGLWQHGPTMLAEIDKRGKKWPQLAPTGMADLIAYLNANKH